ncbi:hypothetical protein K227x_03810 [Rubripirellula lacrimiformis]|uniref:Uncharacterized protein n=1 Tax=Rubripirellula lacrimiformis TaxID=1930273 RepID=A0A517N4E3_9BACT|nr:hypothetical protein K227x_03810 [Rubripirellula lacrimiformis]
MKNFLNGVAPHPNPLPQSHPSRTWMKPGERGLKKGPVCGADVGRIKERSDADPASAHTKRQPPSPNAVKEIFRVN